MNVFWPSVENHQRSAGTRSSSIRAACYAYPKIMPALAYLSQLNSLCMKVGPLSLFGDRFARI